MNEQANNEDKNKGLLANLVMMLSTSAMQQLGKLVNPMTNKAETDLEAAQFTIDMLSMLKDKMEGNLDQDEDRMLANTVASLQMTFVDASSSQPDAAQDAEDEGATEEQAPSSDPPPDVASAGGDAAPPRDPKFHKSYGG